MERTKELFKGMPFFIICLFLIILPFQAFLLTFARFEFNLSSGQFFVLSLWKEALLIFLFLFLFLRFREEKFKISFSILDKLIIAFSVLTILYFLIFPGGLSSKLAGLRYDLEFFLFYFAGRFSALNKKDIKTFFYIFLGGAIIAILFGLLQVSFLPPSFMLRFGYSPSLGDYLKTGIISTYEAVNPSLSNFYRIQSTFPGSLQFSSYLVLVIGLLFSTLLFLKGRKKILVILILVLALAALIATYSRGAWLAVMFTIFITAFLKAKKKIYVVLPTVIIILAGVIAVFALFQVKTFQTLLLHGEVRDNALFGSTVAHNEAFSKSFNIALKNPLGLGIGSAGPASKFSNETIISENGYLQVMIELGVLGFLIFVFILFSLFKELKGIFKSVKDNFYKMFSLGLLSSLSGLSLNNLFLHTWSDTATIYPLFLFIGLIIASLQNEYLKREN